MRQFPAESTIRRRAPRRLGAAFIALAWIAAPACRARHGAARARPSASSTHAPSASSTHAPAASSTHAPATAADSATEPATSALPPVPPARIKGLDRSTIRSRLERAGFKVTSATETTSGSFRHVRVAAERDAQKVIVELCQPGDAYWKARLKKQHAVVLSEGGALLGVIAKHHVKVARSLALALVQD